ncbi:MAG TPA: AGE family epimerase/isomerase [Rhizomicrobium sp.]|nr:AGE family epimerase/isomerase [Rhizomicrobium sp.]
MTAPAALDSLAAAAAAARRWLFEEAAPLWCRTDAHGLFAEQIDAKGHSVPLPHRLRVQARQIYAMCELGRLGWDGDWRSPVEACVRTLLARGRRADGLFIHTFADNGEPLDRRADLYDHAFTLFCLAHAGRALGRDDLWDAADATMDRLESWRHPKGGFREGEIDGPPRRQNPHMHLLEASLALWQATGRARWKDLAVEIASLCRSKFIDPATGALTEYFVDDWGRLGTDEGALVEPGHCLEWAWLFERLGETGIADGAQPSDGLAGFARRFGLDRDRDVAINEIGLDGRVRSANARLWPQTERLKAALARWRRTRRNDELDEALLAVRGLWRYFEIPLKGSWRDVLKPDGTFVEQPAPASSFYHIVCALSELLETADAAR